MLVHVQQKDLKRVMSSEKDLGLSLNFAKSELCFLGNPTITQHKTILRQFRKVCPSIKVTAKDQLVILGHPLGDV